MKKYILILVGAFISSNMLAQTLNSIIYSDSSQKLNGLITSNVGKKLPGVVILPAWKGIDLEAKTAALELEKQGYIAFIADIYGEGNIPTDNAAAAKIATFYKSNYKAYQHRIKLALEQLINVGADTNHIAVIGYCFGGSGALEVARAGFRVSGVVSIHGGGVSKAADRPNGIITTKILVEHPANDKSVSKEDYDKLTLELNEGKADWQIITYANCGHTFTNPLSPEYNPVMATRAWQHTLQFLKEILQ